MGVNFLLELLENRSVLDAVVEVDLLQVAREFLKSTNNASTQPQQKKSDTAAAASSKFCLVLDGECCLNRLYGGFFSDWICGGQWNRMAEFLDKLITLTENANIELTVFFNGAIESQRMNEWIAQQKREYDKMNRVLAHVAKFGYPPSNKLWIAPVGLRMALRMMLRHKNVNVVSTIDDYRQEVIAYCRENNFHGIVTDDAEYIAFDPPRLFSANKFKMKFKGTLESREYIISDLMKELQLTNEKLCVLVALLGNYLLTEYDLRDVYKKADIDLSNESAAAESAVKKLAKYLNDINTTNDLDEIVTQIFGAENDARGPTLKQSIQYYMDGTKDGFLKYRSVSSGKRDNAASTGGSNVAKDEAKNENHVQDSDISQEPDLDTSKLASENATGEKNLLNTFKEAQSCFNSGGGGSQESSGATSSSSTATTTIEGCLDDACISGDASNANDNYENSVTSTTSSETSSISSRPAPATFDACSKGSATLVAAEAKNDQLAPPILPPVPHEVMRTVSERHSKGLMSPYIYQILSQGEIKLPVILEDGKQIPNVYLFYKPVRQMVYAIVFNLHHHMYMASKNNTAVQVDIRIKEWIFNATAQTHQAEYVRAEPVGWRVPTIQRLWFGTTQDDKRRRLRAFLTCMRSDVQLLLNPEFVPQQLLVAAVVLRYIMSFPEKKILRKPELDAFIVAALSPEFSVPEFIQDVKIPQLSCRGIQLAALFMKGVEMAMLVNDACGAPIPWLMCCPWLFFDGKLFQWTFVKASSVKNLHELCDNRVGLVMRAERMRQAILEGLNVQFARPQLPSTMLPSAIAAAEEFKSAAPYSHPHHYHQQSQQHRPHHHHHHHQQQQQQQQQHRHHHYHQQHQHQHHYHHHSQTHVRPSYMNQHRMRMAATTTAATATTATTTTSPSSSSSASAMALSSGMGDGAGRGGGGGGRRSLGGRLEIAGVVVGSWGANYNLSQPSYESATAAYIVPASGQQPPPAAAHRSHHHQFIKKKPAKKEKQKPGKGRGLGIVDGGGGDVSSSDGNNGSANDVDASVRCVGETSESQLPNGVGGGAVAAADVTDSSDTVDRRGRGDGGGDGDGDNGAGTDDDRFRDVIINGAVGTGDKVDGDRAEGGGNEDVAESVKCVRDTWTKSSPEAVSK